MIHTPICDLLGIEYPIFQGGMAWVADGKLAAAVSAAGGLGIIGAGNAPGSYVREQIQVVRAATDKPFGVNVMLMSPFADEVAQVIAEEKVPVVTTGAGNPSKYMEQWKNAGCKVIPVVASVSMAKLMTRVGASAVIAEGGESGGHIGELATMPLVPQVCDATDLPVIAAGGIGDGRGVAAAFMLGAVGVQLGTRFLVAHECSIHPTYKEKVLKATDLGTITTGKRLGHPVRSLKTPLRPELRQGRVHPDLRRGAGGHGRGRAAPGGAGGRRPAGHLPWPVRSPVWSTASSPLPRSSGKSSRRPSRSSRERRNGSDSLCISRPGCAAPRHGPVSL